MIFKDTEWFRSVLPKTPDELFAKRNVGEVFSASTSHSTHYFMVIGSSSDSYVFDYDLKKCLVEMKRILKECDGELFFDLRDVDSKVVIKHFAKICRALLSEISIVFFTHDECLKKKLEEMLSHAGLLIPDPNKNADEFVFV